MVVRRGAVLIPGKRQGQGRGLMVRVSVLAPLLALAVLLLGAGAKLRRDYDAIVPLPTNVVATAMGMTINDYRDGTLYYHLWCNPFPYADAVSTVRVTALWEGDDALPVTDERVVRTATAWDCGTDAFIAQGQLGVPDTLHGEVHLRLGMEWSRPGMNPEGPPAAYTERDYRLNGDGKLRRW